MKEKTFETNDMVGEFTKKEYVVAGCERLNVRIEPSKDSAVLFVTTAGTRLVVDDVQNGWAHVSTKDKKPKTGYAMKDFLKEI